MYLPHDDVPGLAMSRSLGDFAAHTAGRKNNETNDKENGRENDQENGTENDKENSRANER